MVPGAETVLGDAASDSGALPLLLSLSLLLLLLLSAVGWRCQAPHPPLLHELAQPC